MPSNNFLPFGHGPNANVLSSTEWASVPSRTSGFSSGIAISSHINTAITGSANLSRAVAQFVFDQLGEDVVPTAADNLVTQFSRAQKAYLQKSGACPMGSVVFYFGSSIPTGWLLCNGASLSRVEYPELFSIIGTKCGANDESTFKIPDTHHRFLEGTTTLSEIGAYILAGLPNIHILLRWRHEC